MDLENYSGKVDHDYSINPAYFTGEGYHDKRFCSKPTMFTS